MLKARIVKMMDNERIKTSKLGDETSRIIVMLTDDELREWQDNDIAEEIEKETGYYLSWNIENKNELFISFNE